MEPLKRDICKNKKWSLSRAHKKLVASSCVTVSGCVASAILQRRKQEHDIYFKLGLRYENIVSVHAFLHG